MTTAQVIEIGPGNRPQFLHRDLENWFPFIGMGPRGPEVATREVGSRRAVEVAQRR